jgi:hypothetical protein
VAEWKVFIEGDGLSGGRSWPVTVLFGPRFPTQPPLLGIGIVPYIGGNNRVQREVGDPRRLPARISHWGTRPEGPATSVPLRQRFRARFWVGMLDTRADCSVTLLRKMIADVSHQSYSISVLRDCCSFSLNRSPMQMPLGPGCSSCRDRSGRRDQCLKVH